MNEPFSTLIFLILTEYYFLFLLGGALRYIKTPKQTIIGESTCIISRVFL